MIDMLSTVLLQPARNDESLRLISSFGLFVYFDVTRSPLSAFSVGVSGVSWRDDGRQDGSAEHLMVGLSDETLTSTC